MSTFRKYDNLNPTVFFWAALRSSNGTPDSNEDVRVSIYDCSDNTEQIFSLSEIGNTGYYKYMWNPVVASENCYFATIYINDAGDKRFIIDTVDILISNSAQELVDKIDENDGMAF